jgi:rubrerythrin
MTDYTEKDLVRILRRDLEAEFKTVKTYLDHLEELNYKSNKRKIDVLTLDSIEHARALTTRILDLQKEIGGPLDPLACRRAAHEETALQGIYSFELQRTKDTTVRRLLKELMSAETKHLAIVKSLR